jgi:hypothetical protein
MQILVRSAGKLVKTVSAAHARSNPAARRGARRGSGQPAVTRGIVHSILEATPEASTPPRLHAAGVRRRDRADHLRARRGRPRAIGRATRRRAVRSKDDGGAFDGSTEKAASCARRSAGSRCRRGMERSLRGAGRRHARARDSVAPARTTRQASSPPVTPWREPGRAAQPVPPARDRDRRRARSSPRATRRRALAAFASGPAGSWSASALSRARGNLRRGGAGARPARAVRRPTCWTSPRASPPPHRPDRGLWHP